jgi:hypothetical protein
VKAGDGHWQSWTRMARATSFVCVETGKMHGPIPYCLYSPESYLSKIIEAGGGGPSRLRILPLIEMSNLFVGNIVKYIIFTTIALKLTSYHLIKTYTPEISYKYNMEIYITYALI